MKRNTILIILSALISSCNYSNAKRIDSIAIVESVDTDFKFKKPYYVVTNSYNFESSIAFNVGDRIVLKPTRK